MTDNGWTLAVCAEMVFRDQPIEARARLIHDLGFAVEIWDWTSKDLAALAATRARFTSMTGYVEGNLTDPDGAEALMRSAQASIAAAATLGSPNLNLHGTGLDRRGLPVRPVTQVTGTMWITAAETLSKIADLGKREGVVFCLENLNTILDHPGTPFATAADTRALVQAVDSPHLRMNLDLYHAQIGEGNLIELIRRAAPYVGEVQVADVPGRCEPGTGEVAWPAVARAAAEAGYDGVVLAALGVGHVSTAVAEAVTSAGERLPMVFASRTGGGTTAKETYGFVGSERDLLARGAVAAGWLTPVKARLLLWSLLRQQRGREEVAREFTLRGAASPKSGR